MTRYIEYKKIPRNLIYVFLSVVVAVSFLAYFYFQQQKSQINDRIENELVAISKLKVDQVSVWRRERRADAEVIRSNTFIVPPVLRLLSSGSDRENMLLWLKSFNKENQYENILLLDAEGRIRASLSPERNLGPVTGNLISEARKSGHIIFSDFYIAKDGRTIRQSLIVPVMYGPEGNRRLAAFVMLRLNLDQALFPVIKTWPTASRSAETLLMRQEGREMKCLNYQRDGDALTLSARLDGPFVIGKENPNAQIFHVLDQQGARVLATARNIPGTPWSLVAKVDADEVYAPITQFFWITILLSVGIILLAAAGIALIWRHQSARYYRSQYEAEVDRVAILRHYEPLTRYANDSILLLDSEGNILEANERASAMLGYPLEELLAMNVRGIGAADALWDMEAIGHKLNGSDEKGLVFESEYRRKDHTVIPVEVSLRAFEIEGRIFFQAIIRDITERKYAESRMNAMNALLGLFMKKTSRQEYLSEVVALLKTWSGCGCVGIRLLDKDGNIRYASYAGFSRDFADEGGLLSVGRHQCTCIRMILGKPDDLDINYMTLHGSFVCNDLKAFANALSVPERKRYRDRCFREGFRSFAVVPVKYQKKILGAIQIADRKAGLLEPRSLGLIEAMSPLIGEALYRFTTEEALRLSEEHYRSLIESSQDCIYQLTLDGEYLSMNSRTLTALGVDTQYRLMGRPFIEHVMDGVEPVLRAIRRAGHGETVAVRYKSQSAEGSESWWEANHSPVRDLDGRVISILGISRDITQRIKGEEELKASHAQLSSLSAHLQLITEEERTRIAREVHDELGQVLTVLKMETAWLASRIPTGYQVLVDKTGSMLKLIDSVIQSVKRICTELRPTLLDHLGISAAIEWQIEEFRKRTGIECDLHLYAKSVDKDTGTVLFRVLQEALTNIARHSSATRVKVMLRKERSEIVMRVTDNGIGIKKEQLRKTKSFGILGMRERVHSRGGKLTIRGFRAGGTSISIRIPVEQKQTKAQPVLTA